MLYGLLVALYLFIALIILLLVLIQQGKSSMGIGSMGGSNQMLFGGSGGQNLFQKVTWVLGAAFMGLSLSLALMKSSNLKTRYLARTGNAPAMQLDPQKVTAQEAKKMTEECPAPEAAQTSKEKAEKKKK
jgi:preprotein translocase subunit SecG